MEAYQWYEEKQTGLGERFLRELDNCYSKIETWPESYAKIRKDFRQVIFPTFPYVVVFKIHENDVVVYSVIHSSRSLRKKFRN